MTTRTLVDDYDVADPKGTIQSAFEGAVNAAAEKGADQQTKKSPWKPLANAVGKFASSVASLSKVLNAFHEAQSGVTLTDIFVNVKFQLCVEVEGEFAFVGDTGYGAWSDTTGLSFKKEDQRKRIPKAYLGALTDAATDVAEKIKAAKE